MAKDKGKKKNSKETKKERLLDSEVGLPEGDSPDADAAAATPEAVVAGEHHPAPELKVTLASIDPVVTAELHAMEATLPSVTSKLAKRKAASKAKSGAAGGPKKAAKAVVEVTKKPAVASAKRKAAVPVQTNVGPASIEIEEQDVYFFREGTHRRLHEKLGAHLTTHDGVAGVRFAVWAPNAREVSVVGDFNEWNVASTPLAAQGASGIWIGFVPGLGKGAVYKYHVVASHHDYRSDRADPFGLMHEHAPDTASVVWDLDYHWNDSAWMERRAVAKPLNEPMSIYEIHLGSWRRVPEEGERFLTYRELAEALPEYLKRMGFTHVELMPVMEHPFYGSWGYQATGFFAPTSRFGTPQDLMYLVDRLHQEGIGVILDWVPSHFPTDGHALAYFDGTHLYEPADPRRGFHPDWKSMIFDYGRPEVRSFLTSSAIFWLEKFHADVLRVDAVASMLYLDYSRKHGEWVPNKYGGREYLEAIEFLRKLNEAVYGEVPGAQTIAEESTAWPHVSKPTYVGGLGFGFKWDMGWMHDTLKYMAEDPISRKYHHEKLTFRQIYATSENFVLSLSHDEVVHMKGSLFGKMPGDPWKKLANLRLLYSWMYAQSGKKLLFMGAEIGQVREWNHDESLDWHVLDDPGHAGLQRFVQDLNGLYRGQPAMWELDPVPQGFEWIDCNDWEQSIVAVMRRGKTPGDEVIAVLNFTPVVRYDYRIGAPREGKWTEILNSDSSIYGGSGVGNMGEVVAIDEPHHGRPASMSVTIPPLGAVFFRNFEPVPEDEKGPFGPSGENSGSDDASAQGAGAKRKSGKRK